VEVKLERCSRIAATTAFLVLFVSAASRGQDGGGATANDPPANAGAPAAAAPAVETDGAELAKKFNNPIADLVSVPFQMNWENGIGRPDLTRFILNIQPVMPFAINERLNLIARVVAPIISQPPVVANGIGVSGVGDPLASFFLSPATSGRFTWGIGPAVSLPSTNDPALGSQKWAAGPTAVALMQQSGWTIGALWNQVWSFAGNPARPAVNQMFLQPFVAYTTKGLWTITVNSESSANWELENQRWNAPINFMLSKLSSFGMFPASYQFGYGYFVAQPDTLGATWKVRASIAILLPKKK